jgi:hypothetical protein
MTKRAVVVGINDYTGIDSSGKSNLNCSVADANSIVSMLSDAFGYNGSDVTLITDQAATRDAVLAGLTTMISASQAGDVALFYYSGHGSMQADDPNDPNCQRFYESMCTATRPFLTDKDLFNIADQLQPSFTNFTVIADSCHSGGLDQETDAAVRYRSFTLPGDLTQQIVNFMNAWVPVGISAPLAAEVCQNNVSNVTVTVDGHILCDEDPNQLFVDQAKMTLLSGCRFWELSWETNGHGLLTQALLDTVNSSDFQINHSDLQSTLQSKMADSFQAILPSIQATSYPKSQVPQLRGQANRMSEGFLQGWTQSK